jgi:ribose transport system ATP-binding protein
VGQNGAGKSTLIKILAGYHAPDSGTLEVNGSSHALPLTPQQAGAIGLRFVHQNLALIRAGTWAHSLRPVRWRAEEKVVKSLLASLNADIDPKQTISQLTPSQRAIVAIVRALQGARDGHAILVFDEPTASLNRVDSERLFSAIRSLRDEGHSIMFVSHRLDEVLAIADQVSVIRDGRLVLAAPVSDLDETELIRAIVGRDISTMYPDIPVPSNRPALQVSALSGATIKQLDLDVGEGEIVGVTGLAGMGQDELPYLIFGAERTHGGEVSVDGQSLVPASPATAIKAGVALVPADRERAGSVRVASVAENITIGRLGDYFRAGRMRPKQEEATVSGLLKSFQVRPPRSDFAFGALSGGNQQKVLLAKWLQSPPRVLLLHEPTQGVDIASRHEVFRIIRQAADDGSAVLIFSAEYADLARLCNRVIVLRDGVASAELAGSSLDEARLLDACLRKGA